MTPAPATDSKPELRQLLREAIEHDRMDEDLLEVFERMFQQCTPEEMQQAPNGSGDRTRQQILDHHRNRQAVFVAARIYLESLFKAEDAIAATSAGDAFTERLLKMSSVDRAMQFAIKAHGNQKYGDYPYSCHLQLVSDVLFRFGITMADSPELHQAAWLHDVIEDTNATESDLLSNEFSGHTIKLVLSVTGTGNNRKERAQSVYPRIREEVDCMILKLADRIANVESSIAYNPGKLAMYKKEYAGFREALYGRFQSELTVYRMWSHLDQLLEFTTGNQ